MKIIDNILYIEFAELVDCGVSENTLKDAKKRNSNSWAFINDPADKRRALIDYAKLKANYQELVTKKFGNPYEYVCREPIRNLVKWDNAAEQYFLDYRYGNDTPLSADHVRKYTVACNWLNMLTIVYEDKKTLKKLLKLSLTEFNDHVIELLKIENVDLPKSYRRILEARKNYEERGYNSVIDPRLGNQFSAKVKKDDVSETLLLEMIAHPLQWDDVYIKNKYNEWVDTENAKAGKALYKKISDATVGVHRRNKEHEIIMQREGNKTKNGFNEKYLPQVKGFRPSHPLLFVESDDNHLDLYFMSVDENGKNPYYQNRYVSVVVTDSYNDLVLGYAYTLGDVTHELVKSAYLNAMYFIKNHTGGWHLPHEIKTDKFALKELRPFYEGMGHYIDAALGNKHRGYIEQFFGSVHWKRCIKMGANNFSGNNITAKNRGVNTEWLKANEKEYPLIGNDAEGQIETFFERLRTFSLDGQKSKLEAWLEAWQQVPECDKKAINEVQFLMKFGKEHKPKNGSKNTITNRGMEAQINGKDYSYDIETPDWQNYKGKEVTIIYDPYDMSRVLLTDFDKVRLIARDASVHSRALGDAKEGSRVFLNLALERKREMTKKMGDKALERNKLLSRKGVRVEDLLLDIATPKELKMEAEKVYRTIEYTPYVEEKNTDFDPKKLLNQL